MPTVLPLIIRAPLSYSHDQLYGSTGDDSLVSGAGDDTLWSSAGNDVLDGGGDHDLAVYENQTAGITVTVSGTGMSVTKAAGGTDSLSGIESLHGSNFADSIALALSGTLFDRAGNDTVQAAVTGTRFLAGSGDDSFVGGAGFDILNLSDDGFDGAGSATVGVTLTMSGTGAGQVTDSWGGTDVFSGIDSIRGSEFDDSLTGGTGNDLIEGGAGDDVIAGGTGSDTLLGGDGDDTITPGSSGVFDAIVAGRGNDTVDLTGIASAQDVPGLYHFDLDAGITLDIDGPADTGQVDKGANGLTTLLGAGQAMSTGSLLLFGSSHDDLFRVTPTAGAWLAIAGEAGDDTISITGTDGIVRLDYLSDAIATGITADLSTGTVMEDGHGGTDSITGAVDELRASALADSITGSGGDDSFILHLGDDTLDAGAGHDILRYDRAGVSQIAADLGAGTVRGLWDGSSFLHLVSNVEELRASAGDDWLSADGLSDSVSLVGWDGTDTLIGGAGDDYLFDSAGDTTAQGGEGADYIELSAGDHSVEGGDGFDSIEINDDSSAAIEVTWTGSDQVQIIGLDATGSSATTLYTTQAATMERVVIDSTAAVSLTGDTGDTYLALRRAPEFLDYAGGSQTDQLQLHLLIRDNDSTEGMTRTEFETDVAVSWSTTTADTVEFRARDTGDLTAQLSGVETIRFADGVVSLLALAGPQDSTITGTEGDDSLEGTDGNDTVLALGGDDWISELQGGADSVDGGDGSDTVSVEIATPDNSDVLIFNTVTGVLGFESDTTGTDTLTNVENLHLEGDQDSRATGGDEANSLITDGGDDTVAGGGGDDTLDAGAGDDSVDGGAGNDLLIHGPGQDSYAGGTGQDLLLIDLEDRDVDLLEIDMTSGTVTEDGDTANQSLFSGIEDIEVLGTADVEILGDATGNSLFTGSGQDTVDGGAGMDHIIGGFGADSLMGGADNDLLEGGAGDDTLEGGDGDDSFEGNEGTDVVIINDYLYSPISTYALAIDDDEDDDEGEDSLGLLLGVSLSQEDGGLRIISDEGSDLLDRDVELVQFLDMTVKLEQLASLTLASPSDVNAPLSAFVSVASLSFWPEVGDTPEDSDSCTAARSFVEDGQDLLTQLDCGNWLL